METEKHQRLIRDLSLALMYLTSWEEKEIAGETIRRAWRGYDFEILDKLKNEDLINFSFKAKSLYLTGEGENEARRIIERLQ